MDIYRAVREVVSDPEIGYADLEFKAVSHIDPRRYLSRVIKVLRDKLCISRPVFNSRLINIKKDLTAFQPLLGQFKLLFVTEEPWDGCIGSDIPVRPHQAIRPCSGVIRFNKGHVAIIARL